MADTYLILVIVLFALAIFDLVVGVTNDAVNFLNSSLGSRVAKRRTIMIIASVGIFLGAALSSGMMEVARKSIFHPEAFFFEEIMVIFLAVMLTDIILLDLFNTFGMPTSTTVSIVFELLGSSVTVALIKMSSLDQGLGHLSTYINGDTALKIVVGILLSVVVAFTIGAVVMYLSRLLFTFRYKKKLRFIAPVWAGLAMTTMTYFLLVKGLKNASFISPENMDWIKENPLIILGMSFAFWTVILGALSNFSKLNILKPVVLFGTFCLALAFAGNDLVNFIGVPIAGFQSWEAWTAADMPSEMSMAVLGKKVPTQPFMLIIAGGIMVTTLWFSKKARSVTETEIKLGRQDDGAERFKPNAFTRMIVRFSRVLNNGLMAVLPGGLVRRLNKAFEPIGPEEEEIEGASFDLIRASVNLAVASIIIIYASSKKLPLSTTYVSFMAAMGASLADRAWGRDSAVYRISGVLSVVGGWLGTAVIAFSVSAIFALIIHHFDLGGVGFLVALAIFLTVRSTIMHRRKTALKAADEAAASSKHIRKSDEVHDESREQVDQTLASVQQILGDALTGLCTEDRKLLKKAGDSLKELQQRNETMRYSLFNSLKQIDEGETDTARFYLKVYDLEQRLLQANKILTQACIDHVANTHLPLYPVQIESLKKVETGTISYLQKIRDALVHEKGVSDEELNLVDQKKKGMMKTIDKLLAEQTRGIRGEEYNSRNSLLKFKLAFEMRALIAVAVRFAELFHREGNR